MTPDTPPIAETPTAAPTVSAPAPTQHPTQDERIMAALSHVGILLPLTGLLLPVFIWLTQREKSPYVRFQAMQALVWHVVMIVYYFAAGACYACTAFSVFLYVPLIGSLPSNSDPSPLIVLPIFLPFLVVILLMLLGLVFLIFGLLAAILTLQGKDFRFPVIGARVEKFLAAK
jgi:uncharacterized Tic20 family protein